MICFVVLNYNASKMTIDYVHKLKQLSWEDYDYKIIIIDNNSRDSEHPLLHTEFSNDKHVITKCLTENIGFARGNNVGIQIAKECGADLIVVSNNDIVIEDANFPKKIIELYNSEYFAVYGPQIFCPRKNEYQNPYALRIPSLLEEQNKLKNIKKRIRLIKIIKALHLYEVISRILSFRKKNSVKDYLHRQENVVLHGSFFVISKEYLSVYPEGLFSETFLYGEEDLLALRCYVEELKMLYDPVISIIHLDGVSSLKTSGDKCNKYLFELSETQKSCEVTIDYMKKLNTQ